VIQTVVAVKNILITRRSIPKAICGNVARSLRMIKWAVRLEHIGIVSNVLSILPVERGRAMMRSNRKVRHLVMISSES
jgi:hypothetical protein